MKYITLIIKLQSSWECEGGFGSPHARLVHFEKGWPNVMHVATAEYEVMESHRRQPASGTALTAETTVFLVSRYMNDCVCR